MCFLALINSELCMKISRKKHKGVEVTRDAATVARRGVDARLRYKNTHTLTFAQYLNT